MKKILKKLLIFIILSTLIIVINSGVFASNLELGNLSEYAQTQATPERVKNLGNSVLTIISTVGSIISVIILVILGIKYMIGSVEERAVYKKSFLPYLIGAGILFGVTNLLSLIYNVVTSTIK